MTTWKADTLALTSDTLTGTEVVRVVDDPAGTPTSKKTTAQTIANLAKPASTAVGRLARYTDTAGTAASTAGLYEDGLGKVSVGHTNPTADFDVNGTIKAKSYTVATLPSAATVGAGSAAFVTDAMTAYGLATGGTVVGGGSSFSRVTSDGSNWKQM